MLNSAEWMQVQQARDAYCALLKLDNNHQRHLVEQELVLVFLARKSFDLHDEQVSRLARLDVDALTEILKDFPRTE